MMDLTITYLSVSVVNVNQDDHDVITSVIPSHAWKKLGFIFNYNVKF